MTHQLKATTTPKVSVVIPVYNCEEFLGRCLDSLLAQTMQDFEVIAVDDGSTDGSIDVLRRYAPLFRTIRIIEQENAGQGSARNTALGAAKGTYVFFLDADDFVESVAFDLTTQRADADDADMVHFDWKLLAEEHAATTDTKYYNVEPFWHRTLLVGAECDELLQVKNFFSVCNLYRRSFLDSNNIRFEEGRIYEDNPFLVKAINAAERVAMIHSPLYVVCPHPKSTTRSHITTDRHAQDHVHAVRQSFAVLDRRNPRSAAYLASYHVTKFWQYYRTRVPRKYRMAYTRDFVDALHAAHVDMPAGTLMNKPTALSVKLGIFKRRRYLLFRAVIDIKSIIMPQYKKLRLLARNIKHLRDPKSEWAGALEAALTQDIKGGSIAFLGLDFKYAGNSKYLFEKLIADPRFSDREIRYVTKDADLPEQYRLVPGNLRTNVELARTELVIAESWIPPRIRKHRDSTWIQLWHGTPIKRMLFDSHEPSITSARPRHKIAKYRDIQNWDYLIADAKVAVDIFSSAFLFEKQRILLAGYPRVRYLMDHVNDSAKVESIREALGLGSGDRRKVLLYAPTWRDYNYGVPRDKMDLGYALDIDRLSYLLGEEWVVVSHDHAYIGSIGASGSESSIDGSKVDIQDLILVSDHVVSDYSSIIFDAIAIDTPVALYAADVEKFEESRGLYAEIWDRLAPLNAENVEGLAQRILANPSGSQISALMGDYTYQSDIDLLSFLVNVTVAEPTAAGKSCKQA